MYKFSDIEDAVAAKVNEQLGERIFAAYMNRHKKHDWQYCQCDYCTKKRDATHVIRHGITRGVDWRAELENPRYRRAIDSSSFHAAIFDRETNKTYSIRNFIRMLQKRKLHEELSEEEQLLS